MTKATIDKCVHEINDILDKPRETDEIADLVNRDRDLLKSSDLDMAQALRTQIIERANDPYESADVRKYAQQQYQGLPPF